MPSDASEGGGPGACHRKIFMRPRPLERRKTPLSKKDVLLYDQIKLQFLSEKRQGTISLSKETHIVTTIRRHRNVT